VSEFVCSSGVCSLSLLVLKGLLFNFKYKLCCSVFNYKKDSNHSCLAMLGGVSESGPTPQLKTHHLNPLLFCNVCCFQFLV
jgi:hypothetical protein